MRILVIIYAPLGDSLFTVPSLKALHRGYPAAHISLISSRSAREIFADRAEIDKLLLADGEGQLMKKILELRSKNFDLALGLCNLGSYLLPLVKADKKAGFRGDELSLIYDYDLPDDRSLHAVDYCLQIVKKAGGKLQREAFLDLPLFEENYQKVSNILLQNGIKEGEKLIVIHSGGRYFHYKRWPLLRYRHLIKLIDSEFKLRTVLIGGGSERKRAEYIIDKDYKYNRLPLNLIGRLSLRETAALLDKSFLLIGNDSAPQHLASAVSTPVVTLFGPTDPKNFSPYHSPSTIVRSNLECSPCFGWLGDYTQYLPQYIPSWLGCNGECMKKISVEDVMKAVKKTIFSPAGNSYGGG
ncbi:MAG: glycosyltransferase family 9 protein [Halanaerobiales bacterium]